jgi:hypothetical protein
MPSALMQSPILRLDAVSRQSYLDSSFIRDPLDFVL